MLLNRKILETEKTVKVPIKKKKIKDILFFRLQRIFFLIAAETEMSIGPKSKKQLKMAHS